MDRVDAHVTARDDLALLVIVADCLPVALSDGERVAMVHCGWRGLAGGILGRALASFDGTPAAAIGPGIGPCCYEVGREVSEPFAARFGGDVLRGRNLDLWTSAERALHAAGCSAVDRIDLCTSCNPELFFSERRTGKPRGGHGVLGYVA